MLASTETAHQVQHMKTLEKYVKQLGWLGFGEGGGTARNVWAMRAHATLTAFLTVLSTLKG